jgi:hypothetical protein
MHDGLQRIGYWEDDGPYSRPRERTRSHCGERPASRVSSQASYRKGRRGSENKWHGEKRDPGQHDPRDKICTRDGADGVYDAAGHQWDRGNEQRQGDQGAQQRTPRAAHRRIQAQTERYREKDGGKQGYDELPPWRVSVKKGEDLYPNRCDSEQEAEERGEAKTCGAVARSEPWTPGDVRRELHGAITPR